MEADSPADDPGRQASRPGVPGAVTRRSLLGSAAAVGAAGQALAGSSAATASGRSRPTKRRAVDVVVVGAGLAGLTSATELVRAGRSVVVLEARDRVGGRTLNVTIAPGKVIEAGGQWVGPEQKSVLALAKRLRVTTFPTHTSGDDLFFYEGKLSRYQQTPPLPPGDELEVGQALAQLSQMAATVSLEEPASTQQARGWDAVTLQTWLDANVQTPGAAFILTSITHSVFSSEPRDISLLHALFSFRSRGGLEFVISTSGGAQASRLVGGSQLLSLRLAQALRSRVVLGAPVTSIEYSRRAVLVRSAGGEYAARQVIVAVPPTLAARIAYDPPLPALRDQLTQRLPMGSVIKVELVYPTPFWRKAGLSGHATSDSGPVGTTFDNSPPDGTPGVLLGFIEADKARRLGTQTLAARRRAVLAEVAELFGAAAARPERYLEHNWGAEPWTRGCYTAVLAPGVWSGFGATPLRAPHQAIHWAGTETSPQFMGTMDGAVKSGMQAALAVRGHSARSASSLLQ
jgi:monoamine oxidase